MVVLGLSQDEAIIAADSRVTDPNVGYRDDDCKIDAFEGKIIFVAAGKRRVGTAWDSHESARRAFDNVLSELDQKAGKSVEAVD